MYFSVSREVSNYSGEERSIRNCSDRSSNDDLISVFMTTSLRF
ncbi:hypothetical protein ACU8KH_06649 [Lachancea thermotolerans]